jgi:hypothetical protein
MVGFPLQSRLSHHAGMRYVYPPMTLGNMRSLGVRTLDAWCTGRGCNHHTVVAVDHFADELPLLSFGPRLRCQACGHLGADARPN